MTTVQTSHDECVPFKRGKIVENLLEETEVDEEVAEKIARSISRQVHNFEEDIIHSSEIRSLVGTQLRSRGFFKDARLYERVGLPVYEIKKLLNNHNKDNANMQKNPETFHKYVADGTLKQYALLHLDTELKNAHDRGDLHIHDLEYFAARSHNCVQHDARFFIRNGLKVDGLGEHTSAAGPAKNIETFVNHAGQVLMASQINCSGGQSFPLFNVFMAPYISGLDYSRIKQAMQMFIYNLNMSYTSRGGQAVFSSVNIEFGVPNFLMDEPAYGPGGAIVGTYGDYVDETKVLQRAFTEVLFEGDALGKPHLFPNTVYSMRKEFHGEEFDEDLLKVLELSNKFSTPYFLNQNLKSVKNHVNVMGCRTKLTDNWTGDWDLDTLRTGNNSYVTINLPRLAYKSTDIWDNLDAVLELAKTSVLLRREQTEKLMNNKMLSFLSQPDVDGSPYFRLDNATLSFGFVGMDEFVRALGCEGIESVCGARMATAVLQHMNDYARKLTEETGYRWTILQTPGETTAHRFAMLDKKYYPDKAIVNGKKGSYYYTNSSHMPVDSTSNLIKRLKVESGYHDLTKGGHIFHAWMGERASDPVSMANFTKKIADSSDIGFWAYSSAFSHCFNCNTHMRGLHESCGNCGSTEDVEWYDRVTGYMQQVGHKKDSAGGWNPGKMQELMDRKRHSI